jgi:hypothetical protein
MPSSLVPARLGREITLTFRLTFRLEVFTRPEIVLSFIFENKRILREAFFFFFFFFFWNTS